MKKRILCFALILFTIISLCIPIQSKAAQLKLNKAKATLEVDATLKLKLNKIAANKINWSTSNKKVAIISKKGIITAKAEGSAIITATYNSKKYNCLVTVVDSNKSINTKSEINKRDESVNFKPLTYSGSGDSIITGIVLPKGIFVATIKIDSTRHYDVKFHLNNDDYELLVNNSGEPYAGSVLIKGSSIEAINDGILEIDSEGDWEVKIDMLSSSCTNNITGTGDTVTGIFNGTGKKEVIKVKIDSTRHYHVKLYEITTKNQENYYDLLINDSGEVYSGEVLGKLQAGKQYFFEVNAEGDWSISFGEDPVTQYINGVVQ